MSATKDTIIGLDQGTSSSRALLFDQEWHILSQKSIELPVIYPQDGWVEQDPEKLWKTSLDVVKSMVTYSQYIGCPAKGIGITNQRETTIIWERDTGKPIYNAIVWQDRRTADFCMELRKQGYEKIISEKTGLLLDPYFSASKIKWILDHVPDARKYAEAGRLCFGTVDSFLLWRFSNGARHATDATNASRTCLYNITEGAWDEYLLKIFDIPKAILPEVCDCSAQFTHIDKKLIGDELPVLSMIGDQQAAAIGQACVDEGSVKSTYGTGCFVIMNTGRLFLTSQHRLLSTIAWQINGQVSYALEGSIFISGAIIQWLRDQLNLLDHAAQSEGMAASLEDNQGIYMVPALTGLGAPHWEPNARGAIYGLTRNSGPKELVRAALESVAYQTYDLFKAMSADGLNPKQLRIDGGMTENNWLAQFIANILNITVERPSILETAALGTAILARITKGDFKKIYEAKKIWKPDRMFQPNMHQTKRHQLLKGWHLSVKRTLLKE